MQQPQLASRGSQIRGIHGECDGREAAINQSINQSIICLLTHDKTHMLTPGNTQNKKKCQYESLNSMRIKKFFVGQVSCVIGHLSVTWTTPQTVLLCRH